MNEMEANFLRNILLCYYSSNHPFLRKTSNFLGFLGSYDWSIPRRNILSNETVGKLFKKHKTGKVILMAVLKICKFAFGPVPRYSLYVG